MSIKMQKGPAIVAVVALGLATWSGGAGVTRVEAQGASGGWSSSLDVDYAGPRDDMTVGVPGATKQPPARTSRFVPQSAAAGAAVTADLPPASAEPSAPGLKSASDLNPAQPLANRTPAVAVAAASGAYAEPRIARGEHRLQAPFPEHNVVVCVAGCSAGKEAIVFFEKRVASNPTSYGRLGSARVITVGMAAEATGTPARPVEPVPAAAGGITCLAGCYSTPKSYSGRRSLDTGAPSQQGRVVDGTWMTVTTASDKPVTDVGVDVGVNKRGRQKIIRRNDSLGSEWFTRRF